MNDDDLLLDFWMNLFKRYLSVVDLKQITLFASHTGVDAQRQFVARLLNESVLAVSYCRYSNSNYPLCLPRRIWCMTTTCCSTFGWSRCPSASKSPSASTQPHSKPSTTSFKRQESKPPKLSKMSKMQSIFRWGVPLYVSLFLFCYFLCFSVSLFLCFFVSLFFVSLFLCFFVSLFHCFIVSLFHCFFDSLFLCFFVYLFLCFSVFSVSLLL